MTVIDSYVAFQEPLLLKVDKETAEKLEVLERLERTTNLLGREAKRFFALLLLTKQELQIGSKDIDEIWREFICQTRQYMTFCNEIFGRYVHREIAGQYERLRYREFAELYQKWFDEEPPYRIWHDGYWRKEAGDEALEALSDAFEI